MSMWYFRQRDSPEGDQCPQGELEQHGRAFTGRAGGLQSKNKINFNVLYKTVEINTTFYDFT